MINIAKLFRQPCQVSSEVKVIEEINNFNKKRYERSNQKDQTSVRDLRSNHIYANYVAIFNQVSGSKQ